MADGIFDEQDETRRENETATEFKLKRRRESVTAEEILAWMQARPGCSWVASIRDVERALDDITA